MTTEQLIEQMRPTVNRLLKELEDTARQRNELLVVLKQTWCANVNDDHAIGDEKASGCPVCAAARAVIAKVERVTGKAQMTPAQYDKCFAQGDPITKLP